MPATCTPSSEFLRVDEGAREKGAATGTVVPGRGDLAKTLGEGSVPGGKGVREPTELELRYFCDHFLIPYLVNEKRIIVAYSQIGDDGRWFVPFVFNAPKLGIRSHTITPDQVRKLWRRYTPEPADRAG